MFEPRSQTDIVEALLAFRASDPDVAASLQPTDLAIGSRARSEIESMAMLLEENEQRFAMAVVGAIEESALSAFGFGLLPPQKAVGGQVFTTLVPSVSPISIPSGTQLLGAGGVLFETTAAGVIPAGDLSSDPVPIRAMVAGPTGNLPEGSISRLVTPLPGVDETSNPAKTQGGATEETPDARASRVAAYFRTLTRGTKEALEFAAISASPAVLDARSIEPCLLDPRPSGVPFSGLVWLFCDDGTDGASLDPGVAAEVSKLVNGYEDAGVKVPGYKSAGTKVEVLKMPRAKVCVRGDVRLRPGGVSRWEEIKAALTAAAGIHFETLRSGDRLSYQNLVAGLSSADPDLAEVDLVIWREGDLVPAYGATISADDLSFYVPANPLTLGARGVLKEGAGTGPSGAAVVYPEWRLV